MVYDEALAERVRSLLSGHEGLTEKKMFGGISFMLGGKMCVGVIKDDLVVRVGPKGHEEALLRPHVREMDFTGHSIKGFVYVGPGGYDSEEALAQWVELAVDFVGSIREKQG